MVWRPRATMAQELLRVCREVQGQFGEVEGDNDPAEVFCCAGQIWSAPARSGCRGLDLAFPWPDLVGG